MVVRVVELLCALRPLPESKGEDLAWQTLQKFQLRRFSPPTDITTPFNEPDVEQHVKEVVSLVKELKCQLTEQNRQNKDLADQLHQHGQHITLLLRLVDSMADVASNVQELRNDVCELRKCQTSPTLTPTLMPEPMPKWKVANADRVLLLSTPPPATPTRAAEQMRFEVSSTVNGIDITRHGSEGNLELVKLIPGAMVPATAAADVPPGVSTESSTESRVSSTESPLSEDKPLVEAGASSQDPDDSYAELSFIPNDPEEDIHIWPSDLRVCHVGTPPAR